MCQNISFQVAFFFQLWRHSGHVLCYCLHSECMKVLPVLMWKWMLRLVRTFSRAFQKHFGHGWGAVLSRKKKDPTWWDLEFLIWIKLTIKESRVDVIQLAAKPMFWKSHPLDANGLVERLKRKSSTSLDFGTGRLIKTKKPCKKRSRKLHQRFWFSNLAQTRWTKACFCDGKTTCLCFSCSLGFFIDQMTLEISQPDRCLCHLPAENFGAASPKKNLRASDLSDPKNAAQL